MAHSVGVQRVTADGVVGRSGLPVRVYEVTWLSDTTAGYVGLRNGTTTASDLQFYLDGTADKTKTQMFNEGLLFANGCYCDIDANVTWAVVSYSTEA
jgi:hypothetical protein